MSFEAGSQGEAHCDGCDKSIWYGSYCYCQDCAKKGIAVEDHTGGTRATMALVSAAGSALAEWRDDEILSLTKSEQAFVARIIESMDKNIPFAMARRLQGVA